MNNTLITYQLSTPCSPHTSLTISKSYTYKILTLISGTKNAGIGTNTNINIRVNITAHIATDLLVIIVANSFNLCSQLFSTCFLVAYGTCVWYV